MHRGAWRLDAWFHGRGETLSEVNFIYDREHNPGEFTPPDAFVLHLYGRYCNASKFAGETDFFEALADVKKHYRIDDRRIVVRGFSMGGAVRLAVRHALRRALGRRRARRGLRRNTRVRSLQEQKPPYPDKALGRKALALDELHRLRRELVPMPARRLQRRIGMRRSRPPT